MKEYIGAAGCVVETTTEQIRDLRTKGITELALKVLCIVCTYELDNAPDDDGMVAFRSVALRTQCGINKTGWSLALKALEENGIISRTVENRGKGNTLSRVSTTGKVRAVGGESILIIHIVEE